MQAQDSSLRTRGRIAAAALAAMAALLVLAGCFNLNVNVPSLGGLGDPGGSGGAGDSGGGSGGDWKGVAIDTAARMTLAAEYGIIYYAYDVVTAPKKQVELVVRVLSVKQMSAVRNATIAFTLGKERLGLVQTDKEGYARLKWKPPKAGDHEIAAAIVAVPQGAPADMTRVRPASLLVSARPKKTKFIVIDLDHTVVDASFVRVLFSNPRPMAGAAGVIKDLVGRGYGIVYLTHRPDLMSTKSKRWLTDHGFVRAPLLVSSLKEAFGDSGKYKFGRLKALRKDFPGAAIGIGDKISDADAYSRNKMTAYLIPDYDRDDDDADDFRELARKIRRVRGAVHVVDTWAEIHSGILAGKRFPARDYAARLDARARRIERKKRDKKKDGNDD